MIDASTTMPASKPMRPIISSAPPPPTSTPRDWPPNIMPLAKARSSSRSVVTASASTATSCTAPQRLCRTSRAVNRPNWVARVQPRQAQQRDDHHRLRAEDPAAARPEALRGNQVDERPVDPLERPGQQHQAEEGADLGRARALAAQLGRDSRHREADGQALGQIHQEEGGDPPLREASRFGSRIVPPRGPGGRPGIDSRISF